MLIGEPTKGEGLWKTKTFQSIDGGKFSVPTFGSYSQAGNWVSTQRVAPHIFVDSTPLLTEPDAQLWNSILNLNHEVNNVVEGVTVPPDPIISYFGNCDLEDQ